ncbi:MAG: hypothetical protein K2X47_18205, partial [Bdellovibrionales bacterium]|nr:hypothetical protein [Bdellovibrionales bacterium]
TLSVLTDVESARVVKSQSTYVAGHSNGAQFTYRLLEKYPDKFRAFAVFAGCSFTFPTLINVNLPVNKPFMFFHGTEDVLFYWNNGAIDTSTETGARDVMVSSYGCKNTDQTTYPYSRFYNCNTGVEVRSMLIPNMTHMQWPSKDSVNPPAGLQYDSNQIMWDFLKKY